MRPSPRALAVVFGCALAAAVPTTASAAGPAARSADAYTAVPGTPPAQRAGHAREVDPRRFHAFTVDQPALQAVLDEAPPARPTARRGGDALTVTVPGPDGRDRRFAVQQAPVLDDELSRAHPEIATYAGVATDDPRTSVRLSLTRLGLHASVVGPSGAWYVDPYYRGSRALYVAYRREDLGPNPHGPLTEPDEDVLRAGLPELPSVAGALAAPGGAVTQRSYRVALVSDPSYARYFGAENVLDAKAVLMNRVNQVYNDDLAIRLVLANRAVDVGPGAGQDQSGDALNLDSDAEMYGPDGPCGSAPCYPLEDPDQDVDCGTVLERNAVAVPQLMRDEEFDLGHIALGLSGGGVAALYAVGSDLKSIGCTGIPTPTGDFYAVDYVAHEMGHQFSGNHTFAGTQLNCSTGNRNDDPGTEGPGAPGTSVEPGSGSSVMAYAGICAADNLQPHSDPYFSQRSIAEISAYAASARDPLPEVQTVSLRGVAPGTAFRLRYDGRPTAPIAAEDLSAATVEARLAAVGVDVDVTPFGVVPSLEVGTVDPPAFGPEGFTVAFRGTGDRPTIQVEPVTGDVSGFAGETVHGGAQTNGGLATRTTNRAPSVTAPASVWLPVRTPFTLTGAGEDPDGDALTYTWEQNDASAAGGTALLNNVKTTGPLFRMFSRRADVTPEGTLESPSPGQNRAGAEPTRTFPDLEQIASGTTNAATGTCPETTATGGKTDPVPVAIVDCFSEFLPTADYVGRIGSDPRMHFRLTARDARTGGGGVSWADTEVRIDRTAGPFRVTSQATPSSAAAGSGLPVAWDVAGTDGARVNVRDVRISLSTDGGRTFPTVLAERTPNDGTATVTLPADVRTTTARLKVEAVGGVFFDLSHADLTITDPPVAGTGTGETTTPAPPSTPTIPATPTLPPPVKQAPVAPRPAVSLTGLARRITASRTGRVRVAFRCRATGTARCSGTVRLRARIGGRTVTVGTATFRSARPGTTSVTVRLTARARRTLAGGRTLSVRTTVAVKGGKTVAKTVRVSRGRGA
ncbi:M12 family metallo-peptidase [Patulibacter sp. SYSU D01012]|uniref:M12 family metallo-peptidase n=1 Tax=Patulibacter sp. SYSU D01012 TaxID=2817381 RepID=UPI001B31543D|nr:M12 family metallo-peptidase [Patulibacter sp. SYSU D01012]